MRLTLPDILRLTDVTLFFLLRILGVIVVVDVVLILSVGAGGRGCGAAITAGDALCRARSAIAAAGRRTARRR